MQREMTLYVEIKSLTFS